MKLIEDMEECILSFRLACEVLYIVNDKGVYRLIEMEEVVDLTLMVGSCKLALKESGGNIQHTRLRIAFLYTNTHSLNEVSLAHTYRAEYKQGVKGLVTGVICN